MNEEQQPATAANVPDMPKKSWGSRHPRAMILIIAALFYIVLFGMCATVFILLLRS